MHFCQDELAVLIAAEPGIEDVIERRIRAELAARLGC